MTSDRTQHDDERAPIIADIHRVFGSVTKGRGYSWSECGALDDYEDVDGCARARALDTDTHWRELVDDATWEPFPGSGGFSFINHEGFRYYLPPTMIRFVSGNISEWFPGHLLREIDRFSDEALGFWSQEQLACIARFIQYMSMHDEDDESRGAWASALKARWSRHLSRVAE